MSENKRIQPGFFQKGMNPDVHPSVQPEGTYRYALNAVNQSDDSIAAGLYNEMGTTLCANLKEGYLLRGATFIEERNQWVVFSYNRGLNKSEIGFIDLDRCVYNVVFNDDNIEDCDLCFGDTEWIHIEAKRIEPCNEVILYWSNNNTYKRLSLDQDKCDEGCRLKCSDLELFRGVCSPTIKTRIIDDGGTGLVGSSIQYTVRLEDKDGNVTDFFDLTQPVYIGSPDNKAGQLSKEAVELIIENLDQEYSRVTIAAITRVGGVIRSETLTTIPYAGNRVVYVHRGPTGDEMDISVNELLARQSNYHKGKYLVQYKGRLILYGLSEAFNLNYQKQAQKIRLKYAVYRVAAKDAHKYKTLRRRERYSPGIQWNYIDNTSSRVFPISGRKAKPEERVKVPISENCTDCELEKWQVEDTSFRTTTFVEEDIFKDSIESIHKYEYEPDEPSTTNLSAIWEEEYIPDLQAHINETLEDTNNLIGVMNTIDEQAEECDDCYSDLDAGVPEPGKPDPTPPPPSKDETPSSRSLECGPAGCGDAACSGGGCGSVGGCGGFGYGACGSGGCGGGCSGGGYPGGRPSSCRKTRLRNDFNITNNPRLDESNCVIDEFEPVLIAEGEFAYFESTHVYPFDKDHECEYMYGEDAGQKIRYIQVPSAAKEPHFISYQSGVPSVVEPANEEFSDTYVNIIGLHIEGIDIPKNLPKPLCPHNPFTIVMQPRDLENKSIAASGVLTSMFEGEMFGQRYLVPKNGLNSLEYFDAHLVRNSAERLDPNAHAGYNTDVPGYMFESPDTHFQKVPLNIYQLDVDLEMNALGFAHGLYAEGDDTNSPWVAQTNQKGYRGQLHLNKFRSTLGKINRCVSASSYVPPDSILSRSGEFTLPVLNKKREGGVFIELNENEELIRAVNSIDNFLTDGLYNGHPDNDIEANNTSDASFLGDVFTHEKPILNGYAHYATAKRWLPAQYGAIENAKFIDVGMKGTWEDLLCGKIQGMPGDAYIGPHTYVRTSYVSSKVGDNVIPEQSFTMDNILEQIQTSISSSLSNIRNSRIRRGLTNFMNRLLNFLLRMVGGEFIFGFMECGDVPVTRNTRDPRNYNGLRQFGGAGFWDGETGFSGLETGSRRVYYPGVQKTLVTTWVESDINIAMRESGDEQAHDIFYPNTKAFETDSWQTNNKGWKRHFLNRFHIELPEVPLATKFIMFLAVFFAKVIIPIIAIFQMFKIIKPSGVAGGIGGLTNTILVFLVVAIMVLLFIIIMSLYMRVINFIIENYLVQLLGITQCYNDSQGNPNNRYLRDFVSNTDLFNFDYIEQNNISINFSIPANYDTRPCLEHVNNRFMYSNQQILESPVDAYRNFRVNNYLDIPNDSGAITRIFNVGDNLFVHTTDTIWNLHAGSEQLETDGTSIYLGSGDLFRDSSKIFGTMEEGFAGLVDRNSVINSQLGYMFLDRKSRSIYIYRGEITDITIGNRLFFRENLKFFLVEQFPDFKNVDQKSDQGVGLTMAVDHKLKRILISKTDYEAVNPEDWEVKDDFFLVNKHTGKFADFQNSDEFINRSFTVSLNMADNSLISYHSYIPLAYLWDRYRMYSLFKNGIWEHNSNKALFQTFYNEYYPFIVEYIVNNQFEEGSLESLMLDTEAHKYDPSTGDYIRDLPITFNQGMFYTYSENSGLLELIPKDEIEDEADKVMDRSDSLLIDRPSRHWRLNGIINKVKDKNVSHIKRNKDIRYGNIEVNKEAIDDEFNSDMLFDNYMFNRLIFSNFAHKDIQILFKLGLAKINKREE